MAVRINSGRSFFLCVERTLRIINPSRPPMFEPTSFTARPTHRRGLWENDMPTDIRARVPGPGTQLVELLASMRWEAQFTLAKCCMRASKSISNLGVFLAEPVLERSRALSDAAARLRENAHS